MTPAVAFRDVSHSYRSNSVVTHALRSLTFEIEPGAMVAVIGPSGSGKSTLLKLAGGIDVPTSGRVEVDGVDLGACDDAALARLRRQTIGYVFQEYNLVPSLTAAENVALPLELDGVRAPVAHAEAREALRAVGIDDLAERFPDDLSGGEQQRTAIARAIVGQRTLLLADEPTGALDVLTGETVMRLLRQNCTNGRTVLYATHNAAHAAWADVVLYLRDGRLVDRTAYEGPESLLMPHRSAV